MRIPTCTQAPTPGPTRAAGVQLTCAHCSAWHTMSPRYITSLDDQQACCCRMSDQNVGDQQTAFRNGKADRLWLIAVL